MTHATLLNHLFINLSTLGLHWGCLSPDLTPYSELHAKGVANATYCKLSTDRELKFMLCG